jgi:HlyD family secretion protein
MTAYVTIPVATAENALKLPNVALRYKPPITPDDMRATYAKYGIDGAQKGGASANGAQSGRGETAVIWKLHADRSLEPIKVAIGITDHAFTEITSVLNGQLKEGDELVTRSVSSASQGPGALRR